MDASRICRLATLLAGILVSPLVADSFVLDPPSPSWPDADDILVDSPGPVSALPRLGISGPTLGLMAQDVIDAISDGRDPIDEDKNGPTALLFSVHRQSLGAAGTGVSSEQIADTPSPAGAVPNGHASDLFLWDGTIGQNVLAPAPLGWTLGTQTGDEANTHLRPVGGGSPGDDVTAYDISSMRCPPPGDDDGGAGNCGGAGGGAARPVFFSLRAGSPTLAAIGAGPGDVLVSGGAFGRVPQVFLGAAALGIPAQADLDALALEVVPTGIGLAVQRAKFSVHRSTVGFLVGGVVVDSGASVLLYDGAATTVEHPYADLGLLLADDLDALESILAPALAGVPGPPIVVVPEGDVQVAPIPGGFQLSPQGPGTEGVVVAQLPYTTGIEATLLLPAVQDVGSSVRLDLPILLGDGERSLSSTLRRRVEGFSIDIGTSEEWRGELELLHGDDVVHRIHDIHMNQGSVEALATRSGGEALSSDASLKLAARLERGTPRQPNAILIEWSTPQPGDAIAIAGAGGQRHSGDRLRLRVALPERPGPQLAAFSSLEIAGRTNGIIAILIGLLHPGIALDGRGVARVGETLLAPAASGVEVSGFPTGIDPARQDAGFSVWLEDTKMVRSISFNYDKIEWSRHRDAAPHLRFAGALHTGAKALPPRIEAGVVVLPNGDFGLAADFGPEVTKVEVFASRQGNATGSVRPPGGQIGRFTGAGELVRSEVGARGVLFGFSEEMALTVEGSGATLSGDAFRIRPVDGDFDDAALVGVEVRGSDIATVVIATIAGDVELFHRGDADRSGDLSLTDAIATLGYLFFGGVTLACEDAADADDDGELAITDPIRTLSFLFLGGVSIPSPAPGEACGEDPTQDALDCEDRSVCE